MNSTIAFQYALLALALISVTLLTVFGKMDSNTATTVIVGIITYSVGHATGLSVQSTPTLETKI